ncbi:MAG: pyrroloquinoline quinone biosynthesis peptide chaperone PqqD [Actinobacteria bacterium]|nr:pyrroloquinoline quinone biosynthesis peptide chaperone PqqD [Actinomycetota bacterium]
MTEPARTERPRLAPHTRLSFDRARQRHVLLTPEAVIVLNDTGAAVLGLCDGQRTLAEIVAALEPGYREVPADEVRQFLGHLAAAGRVDLADG